MLHMCVLYRAYTSKWVCLYEWKRDRQRKRDYERLSVQCVCMMSLAAFNTMCFVYRVISIHSLESSVCIDRRSEQTFFSSLSLAFGWKCEKWKIYLLILEIEMSFFQVSLLSFFSVSINGRREKEKENTVLVDRLYFFCSIRYVGVLKCRASDTCCYSFYNFTLFSCPKHVSFVENVIQLAMPYPFDIYYKSIWLDSAGCGHLCINFIIIITRHTQFTYSAARVFISTWLPWIWYLVHIILALYSYTPSRCL